MPDPRRTSTCTSSLGLKEALYPPLRDVSLATRVGISVELMVQLQEAQIGCNCNNNMFTLFLCEKEKAEPPQVIQMYSQQK